MIADSNTLKITVTDCSHGADDVDGEPPTMYSLNCEAHNYAHKVGVHCTRCNKSFWGWKCPPESPPSLPKEVKP